MLNQKSARITDLKRQGSTSFFPSCHGDHGEHGKHQPADLIHYIYDFKHYIYDLKQSFCQSPTGGGPRLDCRVRIQLGGTFWGVLNVSLCAGVSVVVADTLVF